MSLKVYDLLCEHGHVFEGWFASAQAYDDQQSRGLLSCPVCGSAQVSRKLSAPRLNVSHLRAEKSAPQAPAGSTPSSGSVGSDPSRQSLAHLQAQVLQHMRQVIRNTENVGPRFASEARLMHEGDIPPRPIRGVATPEEREALADDGIDVLPIPDILDDERLQ